MTDVCISPEAVADMIQCLQGTGGRSHTSPVVDMLEAMWAKIQYVEQERDRLRTACALQNDDICQVLAKALGGFPWYKDDQENFPGATEENGVFVGDLVAEDLANLAFKRIQELKEMVGLGAIAIQDADQRERTGQAMAFLEGASWCRHQAQLGCATRPNGKPVYADWSPIMSLIAQRLEAMGKAAENRREKDGE